MNKTSPVNENLEYAVQIVTNEYFELITSQEIIYSEKQPGGMRMILRSPLSI
jgi:hypothetical protein